MVTLEILNELIGADCESYFSYLKNKNKGGLNNSKGNTFENHFTIYKIARSFNKFYKEDNLYFSSQMFAFVDDLVIEQYDEHKNNGWFYQIKNVQTLDWSGGTHPLENDFINQRLVSERLGLPSSLGLVVSTDNVFEKLQSTQPDNLKHVELINFKSANSIPSLIRDNELIRKELIRMCAFENPPNFVLETLAAILLGSWDSSDKKKVSLGEIIENCYRLNPHYIRGLENKISASLEKLFAAIAGFTYKVEGGYIRWTFNNTDEGTLMFRIGSRDLLNGKLTS